MSEVTLWIHSLLTEWTVWALRNSNEFSLNLKFSRNDTPSPSRVELQGEGLLTNIVKFSRYDITGPKKKVKLID